jgi:MYXO-CTERM domain-containing protein
MRTSILISLLAGCAAWGVAARGVPLLQYSQDGKHYLPLTAINGEERAKSYYNYREKSGHPEFGTVRGTSTVAMYWDDTRDVLSLIAISGSSSGGKKDKGRVQYTFKGLPFSNYLALSDDPKEFRYEKGDSKATALFAYKNNTDGLIFSGLERAKFAIRLSIKSFSGVKNWRLVDGDPEYGGDFLALDMKKPLYLRTAPVTTGGHKHHAPPPPTPPIKLPPPVSPVDGNSGAGPQVPSPAVPEPGVGLVLAGVGGLLTIRRRR